MIDFKLLNRIRTDSQISPSSRMPRAMHNDIKSLIEMVDGFATASANTRPIERRQAYVAIDDERDFQDEREGSINSDGSLGDGTRTQHEYILYVHEWTNRLLGDAFKDSSLVQDGFRKVAALCVAAMEEHGSPRR